MSITEVNGQAANTGGADIKVTDGASAPAAVPTWDGFNDDNKGYLTSKGYKDVNEVVNSYRNLEKAIGVPKERLLKLPEKADDPAWNDIYGRLGRPEKPEEYKLELPKDADTGMVDWFKKTAHELGLTRKQAETFFKSYNDMAGGKLAEMQNAAIQTEQQAEANLRKEWGKAYDQNLTVVAEAAGKLGIDDAMVGKLKGALGIEGLNKFVYGLAQKIGGEAEYVGSDGGTKGFRALTPQEAQYKLKQLHGDSDFLRRYAAGETAAVEQFKQLTEFAYAETN